MSRVTAALLLLCASGVLSHHGISRSNAIDKRQAAGADDLAKFGDTMQIMGEMKRSDQDWVDGLALDLFSPKKRTAIVTQNFKHLPAKFVTGSSGEGFMAIANYSYVVKLNEPADDLIAKIELPYDPDQLKSIGIDPSNTYVGKLAPNKKSWVIDESRRNVHVSENKTRIIKMTSLDGEYILLGRPSVDTSNIFVQYGMGATRTVNVTGGVGLQEAEFVDGLRFRFQSDRPYALNADLRFLSNPDGMTPKGMKTLNAYSWVFNSTMKQNATQSAIIRFPVNMAGLSGKASGADIVVAKRGPSNAQAGTFTVIPRGEGSQRRTSDGGIAWSTSKRLDGEYVLLVPRGK